MSQYFYLVLLVMTSYGLSRSRERFFGEARETYNKLMAGLFSWGLLLLVTTIAQSGLIRKIPILSDDQYRFPLEAVLLIAGGTFIISALFEWLPQLVTARESASGLQQRIDFSTELARLLKNTNGNIHQMQRVVARMFSFQSVDLIAINRSPKAETDAVAGNSIEHLLSKHFETLASGSYVMLAEGFAHHQTPLAIVPIKIEEDSVDALLGLWSGSENVTEIVLDNLQLATDILLVGAYTSRSEEGQQDSRLRAMFAGLRDSLVDAERISDHLRAIYDQLRSQISFDLLRIAVFDQRGFNVTQYCLGKGKSLLSELDRSISTSKTRVGVLFAEPQLDFDADLRNSDYEDDRWLVSCGARCAITIPLISNNSVIATVTLASETPTLTQELADAIATDLVHALLPLAKSDQMAHQLVTYNRQILDLTGALKTVVAGGEPRAVLAELLDMLVKKVPTTYCRLWRYNSLTESLEFLGDARCRDINLESEAPAAIPLDRVHWHRQAVLTGRVMVINQRETRTQMDSEEESLALVNGTRSALIIPLINAGKTIGLISLAELRCWERNHFSLSETLFARALANIAAQVMSTLVSAEESRILRRKVSVLEQRTTVGEMFSDLPKRLSTPLTSIMARTDQLISSVAVKDEAASTHLLAIKRQTEKIITEVRNIQDARRTHTPVS